MPASERFQLVIPKWLKDALRVCASRRGVSMAEYIKDALKAAVEMDLHDREN